MKLEYIFFMLSVCEWSIILSGCPVLRLSEIMHVYVCRDLDVTGVVCVRHVSCQTVDPVCLARTWSNLEVQAAANSAVYNAGNRKCPSE
jgi:hypothetical protein